MQLKCSFISPLSFCQKNKKNLNTKVYFYLIEEGYCMRWWTILGLRWSQRDVCSSGYAHYAQKGCFSPRGTILPKNIGFFFLLARFLRIFLNSWQKNKNKKRPNGLLAVLNISWHSPIFSRDGCIFCGRHSSPGVHYLHPDSATVESGCCSDYRHYFPSPLSFSFLLALEYTSLKWSWPFVCHSDQLSLCVCAQTGPAIDSPLRLALAFCHKLPRFTLHCASCLNMTPGNRKQTGSLRCLKLIIWSCFTSISKLSQLGQIWKAAVLWCENLLFYEQIKSVPDMTPALSDLRPNVCKYTFDWQANEWCPLSNMSLYTWKKKKREVWFIDFWFMN